MSNGVEVSKSRISIDLKAAGAATLALISGFSMSGSIMLVTSMLMGTSAYFPQQLYKGFGYLFFGTSILTWAGINYSEMVNLFNKKPSPLDRLNARSANLKTILAVNGRKAMGNELDNARNQYLTEELAIATHRMESANNYQKIRGSSPSIASRFNRLMRKIPGMVRINDYLSGKPQIQARIEYLTALAHSSDLATSNKIINIRNSVEFSVLKTSVEFDIPQLPANNAKEALYRLFMGGIYGVTVINSFMINNIGAIMFGAMSFLSMFNITAYPLKMGIVALFGLVGTLSSLSFSTPNVLNGVNSLFGYNKEEREYLAATRKKAKVSGFFPLSSTFQQLLAMFLAMGAAVANYTANVAFGEVFFAGKNIFDGSVLLNLMSNPLSAHPYSIAFGILGGIGTWIVVAILLVNGTLAIAPSATKDGSKEPSKLGLFTKNTIMSTFALLPAAVATGWSQKRQIGKYLLSSLSPIILTAFAFASCYQTYEQCRDSTSHWLTNLCITATMISSTFISYYLNALPGSTFYKIMPPLAAKASAFATAIGNAELSFSLFNCSRSTLDQAFSRTDASSAKIKTA
jgi:hypothetical protein